MDTSYEVTSVEKTTVFDATSLKKNSSEFFELSNPGEMRLKKNGVPRLAGATEQVNGHG